jgi:hypothetical protein
MRPETIYRRIKRRKEKGKMSFEKLAGIYVYCMDYHGGQWSRLYRLMSRIRFNAPDHVFDEIRYGKHDKNNEWEESRRVYRHLKRRKAE